MSIVCGCATVHPALFTVHILVQRKSGLSSRQSARIAEKVEASGSARARELSAYLEGERLAFNFVLIFSMNTNCEL
jgi:hypothetical protein